MMACGVGNHCPEKKLKKMKSSTIRSRSIFTLAGGSDICHVKLQIFSSESIHVQTAKRIEIKMYHKYMKASFQIKSQMVIKVNHDTSQDHALSSSELSWIDGSFCNIPDRKK
jgi:hypothetical protein